MNASRLAYQLNVLALAVITLILAGAFAEQFYFGELPCPLCLLQRIGLMTAGLGFMLNIRFGLHPLHYGVTLIAALVGAATSARQVLLHIIPDGQGYGMVFFGLHLYTWSFVSFVCILLGVGVLLMVSGGNHSAERNLGKWPRMVMALFLLIVLANLVSTLLECGFSECPSDPVKYQGLEYIKYWFSRIKS